MWASCEVLVLRLGSVRRGRELVRLLIAYSCVCVVFAFVQLSHRYLFKSSTLCPCNIDHYHEYNVKLAAIFTGFHHLNHLRLSL